MIRLTITHNESRFDSFKIEGHSTLGKKGNNLLCAGVSTLAQSIALGLRDILKIKVQLDKKDGFLFCKIPNNLSAKEKDGVKLLLMTMITGFEDLKKQFPDQIQIIWQDSH